MRMLTFLLALGLSVTAQGSVYEFGDTSVVFQQTSGLTVNSSCRGPECLAFAGGVRLLSAQGQLEFSEGGKNPCAVACKKTLGGRVLIGKDLRGNEQSFCHFKDDSYLSCF